MCHQPRALNPTISNTDSISGSRTIITRQRAKMGTEAEQLKAKLEKLERALTQLQTQKDEEIQQLRDVAEEALKLEQERSANLERELKSAALEAELDRHKALDALRAEHQRAIEREQKRKGALMTGSTTSNPGSSWKRTLSRRKSPCSRKS